MSKGDGTYRSYDEMVAEGLELRYEGSWTQMPGLLIDPRTGQGEPISNFMYSCFLAEVSVEVATGKTHVDHLRSAPTSASSTAASTSTARCGAASRRASGWRSPRTSTT